MTSNVVRFCDYAPKVIRHLSGCASGDFGPCTCGKERDSAASELARFVGRPVVIAPTHPEPKEPA